MLALTGYFETKPKHWKVENTSNNKICFSGRIGALPYAFPTFLTLDAKISPVSNSQVLQVKRKWFLNLSPK